MVDQSQVWLVDVRRGFTIRVLEALRGSVLPDRHYWRCCGWDSRIHIHQLPAAIPGTADHIICKAYPRLVSRLIRRIVRCQRRRVRSGTGTGTLNSIFGTRIQFRRIRGVAARSL